MQDDFSDSQQSVEFQDDNKEIMTCKECERRDHVLISDIITELASKE